MVRKSRLRLDTLKSDYDDELAGHVDGGDGLCGKVEALISSVLGIVVLVSSFLLLRSEPLQAPYYWTPYSGMYNRQFPSVLFGCAVTNTASSVGQIVGSLMFLFQDIKLNIWRWVNFVVFMTSTVSILMLKKENNSTSEIPLYHFHFIAIIINCIISTLFLLWNVLCVNSNSKR